MLIALIPGNPWGQRSESAQASGQDLGVRGAGCRGAVGMAEHSLCAQPRAVCRGCRALNTAALGHSTFPWDCVEPDVQQNLSGVKYPVLILKFIHLLPRFPGLSTLLSSYFHGAVPDSLQCCLTPPRSCCWQQGDFQCPAQPGPHAYREAFKHTPKGQVLGDKDSPVAGTWLFYGDLGISSLIWGELCPAGHPSFPALLLPRVPGCLEFTQGCT